MPSIRALIALLSGTLFGFGLALGGMLDPARIRGFLDFFGAFDPSLGFVFAGAVMVSALGYFLARRIARPILAESFRMPATDRVDARLLGGAAIFGVGWGMVGLCPGPAIAALTMGLPSVFLFVAAMLVGMAVHDHLLPLLRPGRIAEA
jgi:uncharacterized membrane protein YedE/YeeE